MLKNTDIQNIKNAIRTAIERMKWERICLFLRMDRNILS